MTLKLRALSEEEQQVIEKVSRSRTAPAWQVERAQIIATALSKPSEVGESYASWTFERLTRHAQEKLGISMEKARIFEFL